MSQQQYTITVSEGAAHMLSLHIHYLAHLNVSAAEKKRAEIIKAIGSLSEMPHRFPYVSSPYIPPQKYRKMFIKNWYIVLYQIKDFHVYVDYIIDCREDPQLITFI